MWRSVPQMDAILTLTSTSVRPNCGLGTSRISMPGADVGLTTASMVFDIRMALGFGSHPVCNCGGQEWGTRVTSAQCEREAVGKPAILAREGERDQPGGSPKCVSVCIVMTDVSGSAGLEARSSRTIGYANPGTVLIAERHA